jgi:hypothetical protein
MSDPREPNADDVESILGRFRQSNLEQLHAAGVDVDQVDFERLQKLIRHAVGSHPDRDAIIDLMRQAMHLFIVPQGDQFELRIGYFDDPALNPPGAVAGQYQTLGWLAVADVMRPPQG